MSLLVSPSLSILVSVDPFLSRAQQFVSFEEANFPRSTIAAWSRGTTRDKLSKPSIHPTTAGNLSQTIGDASDGNRSHVLLVAVGASEAVT